jgi:hypothetical protein
MQPHQHDGGHRLPGPFRRAKSMHLGGHAHVDVTLDCEEDAQPDGRRVPDGGHNLGEQGLHTAPEGGQALFFVEIENSLPQNLHILVSVVVRKMLSHFNYFIFISFIDFCTSIMIHQIYLAFLKLIAPQRVVEEEPGHRA